ncbi:MAG: dTMP kinase [Acidimicrobiia bacterium]|nr:dTMP kinase [Acidimicrobiia bacterium]
MRSRYVGFEGVEGAGKSTVVAAIAARLAADGADVVTVREPGGTPIGEEIRRLLLHSDAMSDWTEAALFAAARAELARTRIKPALDRGAVVLSDRTYYSSLAYQGAARGLGVDAVRVVNEQVLQDVLPDLVVVLDVDPEIGFARETERDRIGSEGHAFQQQVAAAYRALADSDPRVRLVDGRRPAAAVVEAVWAVMAE